MAQNLFRRHRGGSAAGGGGTRETSTSAVDETHNNGGGIDENNNNNNGITTNEQEDASTSNNGNIMMTSLNERDVENPESSIDITSDNNNATTQQQQEEDEENNNDEIQELVVRMPPNHTYRSNNNNINNNNTMEFPNWTLNEDEINTRREAIRTEVERMQRNNCIHFAVLCLVPTSLLLIVVAAILSEDGECSGDGLTVCEREPRTFVNAFTTRCICDAVGSVASMMIQDNIDGRGGGGSGDVLSDMDGAATTAAGETP